MSRRQFWTLCRYEDLSSCFQFEQEFSHFLFCMGPQEQTSFSSSVSAFSLHGGTCISGVLILFCLDALFHFNLFLYDFVLERRRLW